MDSPIVIRKEPEPYAIAKGIISMRVDELIALLSEMPEDAGVVVRGYEGGVDDVVDVKLVPIQRNVHEEWYYGRHAIDDAGGIQAVFIAGLERQPE
jgi:hypothetical protein